MKICLLLTVDDIVTTKIGKHYQVETTTGITLNFSPEAITELFNDIEEIEKPKA